ncbi:hypothetical protein RJ639_018532 [Escallonia herrerae]|uniref:Uncharacterized protein n=1 Tax=Escallonia herrerae TaxID=1293975 RepID=A0AA88VDE4_9ASTE|nr:hypothetical protein RJ639_018532 [Escallonia herrerae]
MSLICILNYEIHFPEISAAGTAATSPTATQTLSLVACGIGAGVSIFTNKFPSVFAATCLSPGDALNARSINNSNAVKDYYGDPFAVLFSKDSKNSKGEKYAELKFYKIRETVKVVKCFINTILADPLTKGLRPIDSVGRVDFMNIKRAHTVNYAYDWDLLKKKAPVGPKYKTADYAGAWM